MIQISAVGGGLELILRLRQVRRIANDAKRESRNVKLADKSKLNTMLNKYLKCQNSLNLSNFKSGSDPVTH